MVLLGWRGKKVLLQDDQGPLEQALADVHWLTIWLSNLTRLVLNKQAQFNLFLYAQSKPRMAKSWDEQDKIVPIFASFDCLTCRF